VASTSEARLNLKLNRSFGKAPDEAPDEAQNFDFAQYVIDFGERPNKHLSHQASIATFCYSVAMESPTPTATQSTPSTQSTFSTPSSTSRRSRSRATTTPATLATPTSSRKSRMKWTIEMEEAILEGLVEAVRKGYRADSSYKAEGWKLALNRTLAVTNQAVNLKHVKSKHNSHKKD